MKLAPDVSARTREYAERWPGGGITPQGYLTIFIPGCGMFVVSRLIWKVHTGRDPIGVIDHINGIRDDNRFENLRDVPPHINSQNRHGDMWARIMHERETVARKERERKRWQLGLERLRGRFWTATVVPRTNQRRADRAKARRANRSAST